MNSSDKCYPKAIFVTFSTDQRKYEQRYLLPASKITTISNTSSKIGNL